MVFEREKASKDDNLTLEEQIKRAGIHEEPESPIRRVFLKLGKWYTLRTYGRLDVPLRKESVLLVVIGSVLILPLIVLMLIMVFSQGIANFSLFTPFLILALFGIFPFFMLATLNKLKCTNCGMNFGVRRIEHIRFKEQEHTDSDGGRFLVITFRNKYKCEFCGKSETKFENQEED